MTAVLDPRATDAVLALLFDEPPLAPNRLLYGVFDGARSPEVHPRVIETGLPARCLFRGPIAPELEANGPWLVLLDREAAPARELVRAAWGRSWGILCEAIGDLDVVARHLRGFLRVRGPEGQKMLFRFYDPRVLRPFLPTLTPEETRQFGGPVRRYLVESADGNALLEDEPSPTGMVRRTRPLVAEAPLTSAGGSHIVERRS